MAVEVVMRNTYQNAASLGNCKLYTIILQIQQSNNLAAKCLKLKSVSIDYVQHNLVSFVVSGMQLKIA